MRGRARAINSFFMCEIVVRGRALFATKLLRMLRYLVLAGAAAVISVASFLIGKRHARRLQRQRRIKIDRFKLKRRHADIELEVFGSREVVQAVQTYSKEHHVSTQDATKQAKVYLREIVPKFNLLAYYRFGAPIARALMRFLYRPVIERGPLETFNATAPKNAVVLYIINHRSNADYVLVAHLLFKYISLSYAVGEWARVWPLNHLFKWFGGYFVRRRYREPLYHAVLSSFVRTITKNGVTQGIFIEGGLSRDGGFLKPKLGMLDYIVGAKRDPDFSAPLFIIPTAINYDRVLEDRNLTEELVGKEDRRTKGEKLRTSFDFLFKSFWRGVFKRFKRYGYAIVTFGNPIEVDAFVRAHPEILSADFETRKPGLQRLADEVMTEISGAIAPTPVTLVAGIFSDAGKPLSDSEIAAAIEQRHNRTSLLREKTGAEVWKAARQVLELRHLIRPAERWRSDLFEGEGAPVIEDAWEWNPEERLLRDYYANALRAYARVGPSGRQDVGP